MLPSDVANHLQRELATRLQRTVALRLLLIPVTSLDPLRPLTSTPMSQPDATPTVASTPTRTLEPTAIPTYPALPTPTAASPTARPTVTASPTTSPTTTATPEAYAVVGMTDGQGVNLRRTSGHTPVIAALRDGTLVQILDRQMSDDGTVWDKVVLKDGCVGWVDANYLVPYQAFVAP